MPTLETIRRPRAPAPAPAPTCACGFVNVASGPNHAPGGEERPHGLADAEFDALFTSDQPVIFATRRCTCAHHRLTSRRTTTTTCTCAGTSRRHHHDTLRHGSARRTTRPVLARRRCHRSRCPGSGEQAASLRQVDGADGLAHCGLRARGRHGPPGASSEVAVGFRLEGARPRPRTSEHSPPPSSHSGRQVFASTAQLLLLVHLRAPRCSSFLAFGVELVAGAALRQAGAGRSTRRPDDVSSVDESRRGGLRLAGARPPC